jgi:hypothetical protein
MLGQSFVGNGILGKTTFEKWTNFAENDLTRSPSICVYMYVVANNNVTYICMRSYLLMYVHRCTIYAEVPKGNCDNSAFFQRHFVLFRLATFLRISLLICDSQLLHHFPRQWERVQGCRSRHFEIRFAGSFHTYVVEAFLRPEKCLKKCS